MFITDNKGIITLRAFLDVMDARARVLTFNEDGDPEENTLAYELFNADDLDREVIAVDFGLNDIRLKLSGKGATK